MAERNPQQIMPSTFRSRLQRTCIFGLLPAAAIAPPALIPSLRSAYAPIYDQFVLPLIGYTWHYYYPYSVFFLLPFAGFLTGLWLAWLFHVRFIYTVQSHVTRWVLHIQPEANAYLVFKRIQLYWITMVGRLKEPYRSWFPLSRIPHRYGASAVSVYLSTVYQIVLDDWIRRHQLDPQGASNDLILERIRKAHIGLAQIYAPSFTSLEYVETSNLIQAITHLDNAQIYGANNEAHIQNLFRMYLLRIAHFNVDDLTVHQMLIWLQTENEVNHTIILRVLINLWFETPSPAISRIIIGQVSDYLDQVERIIDALLINDPSISIDEAPLPELSMRAFARRYIHFIEKARGAAAAIHLRDVFLNLSSQAQFLEKTVDRAAPIKREFIDLLDGATGYQQATDWNQRVNKLKTYRETAEEAIWTALYHTGQPDTFQQIQIADSEEPS